MKAVTNAGPLIALGKLGLVHFLSRLYSPLLIPSPVYDEVVTRGIDLGQADAYAVQMAIARRELMVVPAKVSTRISAGSETPLHAGEHAAIRLAQEEAADWVLLDDQLAARACPGARLARQRYTGRHSGGPTPRSLDG